MLDTQKTPTEYLRARLDALDEEFGVQLDRAGSKASASCPVGAEVVKELARESAAVLRTSTLGQHGHRVTNTFLFGGTVELYEMVDLGRQHGHNTTAYYSACETLRAESGMRAAGALVDQICERYGDELGEIAKEAQERFAFCVSNPNMSCYFYEDCFLRGRVEHRELELHKDRHGNQMFIARGTDPDLLPYTL
jgi:hypothetical protein